MKKILWIALLVLLITSISGCAYLEASPVGSIGAGDVQIWFGSVVAFLGPQILAVVGLIFADVILGIAVAVKKKIFEWRLTAEFFQTNVIPKLLGWMAAEVIVRTVAAEYLNPPFDILGPGLAMVAFLAVIASLGGSVIAHFKDLGIFKSSV